MKVTVGKTEGAESPVRRRILRTKEVAQSLIPGNGSRVVTQRGNDTRGKPRWETYRNRNLVEGSNENERTDSSVPKRPSTTDRQRRAPLASSRPVTTSSRLNPSVAVDIKSSVSARQPVSVAKNHGKVTEVEDPTKKTRVLRELPPRATIRRGVIGSQKAGDKNPQHGSLIGSRRQPQSVATSKMPAAKVNPQKRGGQTPAAKTRLSAVPEISSVQQNLEVIGKTVDLQKADPKKDLPEAIAPSAIKAPKSSSDLRNTPPVQIVTPGLLENEAEQDENKCATNGPNEMEESQRSHDSVNRDDASNTEKVEPYVNSVAPVIGEEEGATESEAQAETVAKKSTRRTRSRRVSPDVGNSDGLTEGVTARGVRRQRRGVTSKKLDEHADVSPLTEAPTSNKLKELDLTGVDEVQHAPVLENEKLITPGESRSQPKRATAKRRGKVASSTVAQEDSDKVYVPPTAEHILLDASSTTHTPGDKRTDRIEPGDDLLGSAPSGVSLNISEDRSVEKAEMHAVEPATERLVVENETENDESKINPPSANSSRRTSIMEYFSSFFTDSSEKENPAATVITASEVASPKTADLAPSGNRRDSVASNCSSCSTGERTIDTSGLVDTKPYYSLNPGMLNDRNLWQDQNLRKLCKILRISSSGAYEDILDRLNLWNRDYEALTQLLERKKNKKVDTDESTSEQRVHTADRQSLAVCNFHSLALGKQHILPMYLRPLKKLPRKLRHKPILSSSARPNDHLHFTPRPVKKNKDAHKPALVFSPYNQVATFHLRKEERQEKRKRIYEIARSVDCMDNPIADLEGDERWVEARRNLFENCFRVRQCTNDERDLPDDDAFDPLYFRSSDHPCDSDLLSWLPTERHEEENSSLKCFASSDKVGSSVFEDSPLDANNQIFECATTPPRQQSQPAPCELAAPAQKQVQQRRAAASMLVPTPPRGRSRTDVVGLLQQSQSSNEEIYSSSDSCDPTSGAAETLSM